MSEEEFISFLNKDFFHTLLMGPCGDVAHGSGILGGDSGGPVLYKRRFDNELYIVGIIAAHYV